MKIIAGLIGGLVFAYISSFLIIIALRVESDSAPGVIVLTLWAIGMALAVTAKTTGKAWRRLLISSAISCFLLPVAGVLMAGGAAVAESDAGGAAVAGTLIGGGLAAGVLGFVGLFLGAVFLIIGLLTGRDKPVVMQVQSE